MEGNEYTKNEDEELNPNSNSEESSDTDSDNFGLPDYSEPEEGSSEESSSEENFSEEKAEEDYSVGEPYSSDTWDTGEKEEDYSYSTDDEYGAESDTYSSDEYDSSDTSYGDSEVSSDDEDLSRDDIIANNTLEEYEQKRSPVGWIILVIILLIGFGIGIFWWLNREKAEPVVVKKPQPVKVEEPVVTEPEPAAADIQTSDESANNEGVQEGSGLAEGLTDISSPTGQYYVIVASAIDDDLLRDYAGKLITKGYNCAILAPKGNAKFSRLAVAEFSLLNDAALKSEELKSEFGEKVWVKKY